MRQLIAFTKKEFMEVRRTGKTLILIIVFSLFGIMNPAIAKLTPWLMEQFSDSFEESGIIVTEAASKVDALTSWGQFYKNVPIGLIIFILLFSGIMTFEYQKGTFVNIITKGMVRRNIILAKTIMMYTVWTLAYWLCFFITYFYNEFYWDNSIAGNVFFSAFCVYMLGIWLISLLIMMSAKCKTSSMVSASTGIVFFVVYLISMVPDLKDFLPTKLMSASELLTNASNVGDYTVSLCVVAVLSIIQIGSAISTFNTKVI